MKRIQGQVSDQTELAMQVLAWITCAKRPLTTAELQSALAVEINESDFDEDNIPDIIDMVSVCAGLVTIDEQSNIIRLVHYTTQEFFQRNHSTWFPKANYDIGSICVAYLSYDTFKTGHCQTTEEFTSRLYHYPFGDYAAAFWASHVRECEADREQSIIKEAIVALLLDTPKVSSCIQFMSSIYGYLPSNMMRFGSNHYPLSTSQIATGLHLAAYFELLDVTQKLISLGGSVNCVDAIGKTPLSWAAQLNRLDAITLLLAHGADPDIKDSRGDTPLFLAAERRHEQAVHLLLEANCDLLSSDDGGQSPLHASAISGSEKITRLLLQRGLTHRKGRYDHSPLYEAAYYGHLNLVQLFLDWDLDVNPQDIELNASISAAAWSGHGAIVQLLLDRGADPNNTDYYGDTPLICASIRGFTSVIQLLLKWGVELEIKSPKGRTALSWAATCHSTEAIQLLLENGADINAEDNDGRSVVFHAASANRYNNLTALFTSTKIRNIHQPDRYGRTPLHVAAIRSHLQSVLTLLKSDGVDCEARDKFGRTALSDSIMRKKFGVVKVLKTFSETMSQLTIDSVVENTTILCDVCMVYMREGETSYHCDTCYGGDFDICQVCHDVGARCLDGSHEMDFMELQPQREPAPGPKNHMLLRRKRNSPTSPSLRPNHNEQEDGGIIHHWQTTGPDIRTGATARRQTYTQIIKRPK